MSVSQRRVAQFTGVGLLGVGVGVGVRSLLPPFVLDEPFWRTFWSGPPVAGLFAVVGALIAYAAAVVGAQAARRSARRQEWWDRAEWALDLARSDNRVDRVIGGRALEGLRDEATESELAMIVAVTGAVTGDVDAGDESGSAPTERDSHHPRSATDAGSTGSVGDAVQSPADVSSVDTDIVSAQTVRRRWFPWPRRKNA